MGARRGDGRDVVDLDAAVDFEPDLASATSVDGVDARTRELELRQCLGDERLAAEAGIDRHDQHEVEFLEHMVEPDERTRRIEHKGGLVAADVDETYRMGVTNRSS